MRTLLILCIPIVAAAQQPPPAPDSSLLEPAGAPPGAGTDSLRPDTEIRDIVVRHAAAVRRCYEAEGLRRNAALRGTLELELTILPVGRVTEATVRTKGMRGEGASEVAGCVAAAARNWRFTRGPYVTDTILLPFTLIPTTAFLPPAHSRT